MNPHLDTYASLAPMPPGGITAGAVARLERRRIATYRAGRRAFLRAARDLRHYSTKGR